MSKARIGMVTIGQAPRADVVPDMAALLPDVEILEPQQVLLGVLRGLSYPGRLGVLTPSERHVPQTQARWRADGFDAAVVPLSPYEEHDPAALARATAALRDAGVGLVVMDCIGFRDVTRRDLGARLGVPVPVANPLGARLAAELLAL